MLKKSRQKFKYLENEKSYDEIKMLIIFEVLSLKQIKMFFLEGESQTLIKTSSSDFRGDIVFRLTTYKLLRAHASFTNF